MKQIYLLVTILFLSNLTFGQNQLLIPPTISDTDISLTLQEGTHEFFNGITTNTMGANGNILGPTLILQQGQQYNFSVKNDLPETTTIHWHGMHVSAENDGGPHTAIAPGETWTPNFTVLDKASTFWYHPHLHEHTNAHVSKGIAGMIIVRDAEEAALDLPRDYGIDDFPLVIQTKDFDNNNQIVVPSNSDDVALVNATIDPVLSVPAQVVRFRILNGSSMRVFNLGLNDNQSFYQIGSDGGLLSQPAQLTRLRLAPGERAEILINLSGKNGQSLSILSYASELPNGIYGATNPGMMPMLNLDGYKPNPLNGTNFQLLKLNIGVATSNAITSIPTTLSTLTPIPEGNADITREIRFTPKSGGPNHLNGDFLINNTSFKMDVINYTIPINHTEIWKITNQSGIAHPFHIHDVQFYILDRNGVAPEPSEQGLKDVVLVRPQQTVRFITKFEDFVSQDVPYMYHCHMLIHEDGGMMGQFVVVDPSGVNEEAKLNISILPNPTAGKVILNDLPTSTIEVYNLSGILLLTKDSKNTTETIDLSAYSPGLYIFKIHTADGFEAYKILKEE